LVENALVAHGSANWRDYFVKKTNTPSAKNEQVFSLAPTGFRLRASNKLTGFVLYGRK
jgi:hypothetical protein